MNTGAPDPNHGFLHSLTTSEAAVLLGPGLHRLDIDAYDEEDPQHDDAPSTPLEHSPLCFRDGQAVECPASHCTHPQPPSPENKAPVVQENDDSDVWKKWLSSDRCRIIWSLHIPKTGGTSRIRLLRDVQRDLPWIPLGPEHVWSVHGRHHNWTNPDLSLFVEAFPRIVVDAETSLFDLKRVGYPWFNITCFFSVLRDPYEWAASANGHLTRAAGHSAPDIEWPYLVHGRGYFDTPNIQSRATAWQNPIARMCVTSADHFDAIQEPLFGRTYPVEHLNAAPKESRSRFNATDPTFQRLVEMQYGIDLALWRDVSRGMRCWGPGEGDNNSDNDDTETQRGGGARS